MKKNLLCIAIASLLLKGVVVAGDWGSLGKGLAPLASPTVHEECLSYDFINLDYLNRSFGSQYFSKGHGYGVGFSKLVTRNIFLTGSYSFGEFDDRWCGCFDDAETKRYRFGAGVRRSIADCVDLTFEGGAEHLDVNYSKNFGRDYDSWGYYFGPGIRARAGRLETFATAYYYHREGDYGQNHIDPQFHTNNYSTDPYGWRFSTGLIYHVTERLGVRVAGEFEKLDSVLSVGGRYHF